MYYQIHKPRTPANKKSVTNITTGRMSTKVPNSVQNMRNIHSLNNSHHRKSQSRYGSNSRKSKSNNKNCSLDKKLVNLFFVDYDRKKGKKDRKVAYIPETIKFKDTNNQNTSINKLKMQKIKKKSNIQQQNKQNKMVENNKEDKQAQIYVLNRDLLRTSLKPNKLNFMARVSNIYDLLISKVMLPQFILYFLGEALFVIKSNKSTPSNRLQTVYDWKLDQFKKICQKIYQNSQQQDLKHFMSLSLPTINRWNSKQNSTKNSTCLGTNSLGTHTQNSRLTDQTVSTYNSKDRANYFRCLNKRDRISIGDQKQSIDILDKLNSKLDNYLKNNLHKIGHQQQQKGFLTENHRLKNSVSRWNNQMSNKENL